MKIKLLSILAALVATVSPNAIGGSLVIIGDDWTVSDERWNTPNSDVLRLVDNSLAWLGANATTHSALVSLWFDQWLHHTNLYQRITAAGFSQTKSATPTWTAQTFAGHDLVVASFSAGINTQVAIDYVLGGGNLLLVTGEGQSYQNVKDFGLAFGIQVLDDPSPSNGPTGLTSSFTPHPVTTGLNSLYFSGPAGMALSGTNPNATIVSSFTYNSASYGLVAAWQVPEPSSVGLIGVGVGVLLSRVRRSRKRQP